MKTHQPNIAQVPQKIPPSSTSFIAAGEASPGHHICLEASSWRGRPQVKRLTPSTTSGWKRASKLEKSSTKKKGEMLANFGIWPRNHNQRAKNLTHKYWGSRQRFRVYPQLLGILSTNMGTLPIFVNVGNRFGSYAWRRNTPSTIWSIWEQNKKIPQYWRWCVYMWSLAPHGPPVSFAGGQWPSYSVIIWKDKLYNNTQIAMKCSGTNEKNM